MLAGCASAPPGAVSSPPPGAAPAPSPASAATDASPAAPTSGPVALPASANGLPSTAAQDESPQQRLARWIAAFREAARAAGVDEATLDAAFANVQYMPRAIELDRAQPEFTRAVWDYLG